MLCEAIDTSPYYSAQFKAHEKSRLGTSYLRALIAVDPWHVAIVEHSSQRARPDAAALPLAAARQQIFPGA
jgi:hypothetical protein